MTGRFSGRWAVFALALVSAVALCLPAARPPVWDRAEAYLIDVYQRAAARAGPETRVVVIDIDEGSLAALGPWPWPRARLAELANGLLFDYEASAVALDLVLPEPGDPAGDAALADLARSRNLVLAQVFDLEGRVPALRAGTPQGALPRLALPPGFEWPRARGFLANHVGLDGAGCAGHINYRPDVDGQVRRVPPFVRWSEADYPSLPLALLHCVGLLAPGGAVVPEAFGRDRLELPGPLSLRLDRDGWRIPWTRTLDAYAVVPAARVLDRTAPGEILRGALVLVGSSSLGLGDFVATPLAGHLPGVMVHAQALSWMLDALGHPAPPGALGWLPWIWLSASLAALTWLSARAGAGATLLAAAASLLAWILVAHLVFGPELAEHAMPPLVGYGVFLLVGAPYQWYAHQRMSRRLYLAFRDYLPPAVLERLVQQDAQAAFAPARRELTILFADIRGSTSVAEQLEPEALAEFARAVLERITRAVHATDGTLDKYLGDGVLAFWGAPLPAPDHAARALEAVRGIALEVAALNRTRAEAGLFPVRVHVGVNTGVVVVGDLGTRFRRSYTVMGEAVNVAFRLQELARERDVFAMTGARTEALARSAGFTLVDGGEVALRGLSQTQRAYVLADPVAAAAGGTA